MLHTAGSHINPIPLQEKHQVCANSSLTSVSQVGATLSIAQEKNNQVIQARISYWVRRSLEFQKDS